MSNECILPLIRHRRASPVSEFPPCRGTPTETSRSVGTRDFRCSSRKSSSDTRRNSYILTGNFALMTCFQHDDPCNKTITVYTVNQFKHFCVITPS